MEILFGAAFGGAVLFLSGRKLKEDGGFPFALWASLLFLAAFALRLVIAYSSEGFSTDMNTFKAWAEITNNVGLSQIYREDIFLDYPPGYLYVLVLLEKLRLLFRLPQDSAVFTLIMKMPSLIADILCGLVVLWAGKKRLGEKNALLAAGAYLLCPAVLVNSAQWGQVDSFCTAILLASLLLLYKEKYAVSALIYGISIACKPQMLIFAPIYLFFTIKRRRWVQLIIGIGLAVAAILAVATPFTSSFHYGWLITKYLSTLHYYHYYTVNACNFWALIGWNWRGLPDGITTTVLTFLAPVVATAGCGAVIFLSKRKDAMFACPALLMGIMYLFGVKMHERYLFPALLFILLAFVFTADKRLLKAYALVTAANYANVAYALHILQGSDTGYDYYGVQFRLIALGQVLVLLYLFYVIFSVYVRDKVITAPEAPPIALRETSPVSPRFTRWDVIAMAAVTLIYLPMAFWNLGDKEMASTSWTPENGQQVIIKADEECDTLRFLPGIGKMTGENRYRVGCNIQVETGMDGETWTDCGTLPSSYVLTWAGFDLSTPGTYVRLTALDEKTVINEVALRRGDKYELAELTVTAGGEALIDEQSLAPLYTTYENSAYFDEIYHARTAYEHILEVDPYENTHPPLGKYFISLGIRIFGLNPFGWRCVGALFGVLMLPALYLLLKQLVSSTFFATIGTAVFALDFMHFTQTRIATIDTYAVFFLLLMYGAMVAFLRCDIKTDGLKKLLPPLLLCGLFMGLGISAKWTAAYGAVGLAVLFFSKLIIALWREKRENNPLAPLVKRSVTLCLWCCLFFVIIPFGIYFAVYLPITTLPQNISDMWGAFWRYQNTMLSYHSTLVAEHPFASPWYEWPLVIRPIWYFSGNPIDPSGTYSTISALGNPLLWITGLLGLIAAAFLWAKEKTMACAVALVGFCAVYLPWVLVPRLTFIYHYFTAVPFLVIALMAVFCRLGDKGPLSRRLSVGSAVTLSVAQLAALIFALGCLVMFIVFFPVISGAPTTQQYADSLQLLDCWYF